MDRKKFLLLWLVVAGLLNAETKAGEAGVPIDQHAGSNATGGEHVCMIDSSSESIFQESLKNCKRGDILYLAGVSAIGLATFCDFTKTIAYTNNSVPVACVYIGARRVQIK